MRCSHGQNAMSQLKHRNVLMCSSHSVSWTTAMFFLFLYGKILFNKITFQNNLVYLYHLAVFGVAFLRFAILRRHWCLRDAEKRFGRCINKISSSSYSGVSGSYRRIAMFFPSRWLRIIALLITWIRRSVSAVWSKYARILVAVWSSVSFFHSSQILIDD